MAIYGPAFVGANCRLVVGKISSSSIGHTSRGGGEVEHSVFHAYVNKYHAGLIGHSYVGPWVNFGAMTTNSDLKNNYSTIKCTLNGEHIDTGSIKVGSFIGDHTKFGIGTLLNTGINIGVSCNLYGGTLIADKEVPSFNWGQTGNYHQYHFDKALETAARSMARRNVELSDAERTRLKQIFEGNLSVKGVFEV
jgi:UDP-N-acetylglucosamine diphosphorylase/glucosamine-1-phosphate N-acetyltransferase